MKKGSKTIIALLLVLAFALAMLGGCAKPAANTPATGSTGSAGSAEPAGGDDVTSEELPSYHFNVGTMWYDPDAASFMNAAGNSVKKFCELVEEKSGGRITATAHYNSVLGSGAEMFDMLRQNELDMFVGGFTTQLDSRFGVFALPGLVNSYTMGEDLVGTRGAALFEVENRICRENNVEMLACNMGQMRGLYNSKKEVRLPEDCKGLLLRVYADEIVKAYWGGLCDTTILSVPEIYTGLQLGTVDGLEFWCVAGISQDYQDVTKYYTDINWQWMNNSNIFMSKALFDSLDPESQKIVIEAAEEACDYYWELERQYVADAYAVLADAGVTVIELTPEERAVWEAYGASLMDVYRSVTNDDALFDEVWGIVNEYNATHERPDFIY